MALTLAARMLEGATMIEIHAKECGLDARAPRIKDAIAIADALLRVMTPSVRDTHFPISKR